MKTGLLFFLFNLFALTVYANRCEKYLSGGQKKFLSLIVNNSDRFNQPQMPRLISLESTKELFEALNQGQVLDHLVFKRIIKTPPHLKSKIKQVSVIVRVSNPIDVDFKALLELSERQSILNEKLNPRIDIELRNANLIRMGDQRERDYAKFFPEYNYKEETPIESRIFAEKFMFRSSIYQILKSSALNFSQSKILFQNRLSAWRSDPQGIRPVRLSIAVKNLTHAEFATILNELVFYIDNRAKK